VPVGGPVGVPAAKDKGLKRRQVAVAGCFQARVAEAVPGALEGEKKQRRKEIRGMRKH
jgi:hypothetical protein